MLCTSLLSTKCLWHFCGVSNPPFLDTLSITSSPNCKLKSQLSQMPSLNGKLSPKPALSITNPKACAQIALLLALSEASAQIVTLPTASSPLPASLRQHSNASAPMSRAQLLQFRTLSVPVGVCCPNHVGPLISIYPQYFQGLWPCSMAKKIPGSTSRSVRLATHIESC
ncbi:hypothetical protein GQ44DRAFT_712215 [Phaeosphaeriaceae sp. PMI808]|nr:hypothetical protein GQ44DRAFT_712215 [Phaeosphaeriaceae sp. PMI808]